MVKLTLRDTRKRRINKRIAPRFKYPALAGRPDRMKDDAQAICAALAQRCAESKLLDWDTEQRRLIRELVQARTAERRLARQYAARLDEQNATKYNSREGAIDALAAAAEERHEAGFGICLLTTQRDT